MPAGQRRPTQHSSIAALLREMKESDPEAAVRAKARSVLSEYLAMFGGDPPFNLEALASFRGLRSSSDAPRHSEDSEIAPQSDGSVVLRINRDRPITRQRFSVGHELGHTLFKDFRLKVQCRKATDRDWADPDDQLEALCDIAASEFVFPTPWFPDRASELELTSQAVSGLASDYQASREATLRRLIEVRMEPMAVVFFRWKLKPTELRQMQRHRQQHRMFADLQGMPEPRLRVDYGITNRSFEAECTNHIPRDKSVPSEGPIFDASVSQSPRDGVQWLDLGSVTGDFAVCALPVFTPEVSAGPEGAACIAALLVPR